MSEGSDGLLQNQIITNEKSSQGSFSFKNANEPAYGAQWLPIMGVAKTFEIPADYKNFTISYDVLANQRNGADFEFVLFTVNEFDEFVPVAGVGIENRGMIYLTNSVNYGFQYATATWELNQWVNVKIEVSETEIKYYFNNVLDTTIANFTGLPIHGFNMLHNNYGGDAYYDNITITAQNLNTKTFDAKNITIYPNPVQNNFSLQLPSGVEVSQVAVYNTLGQKVLSANQPQNIDASQLTSGTYFLKAIAPSGETFAGKVIKK